MKTSKEQIKQALLDMGLDEQAIDNAFMSVTFDDTLSLPTEIDDLELWNKMDNTNDWREKARYAAKIISVSLD